ncbi:hypothetical protein ACHQM5_018948 [Ranunculus cassubicifolius]
MATIFIPPFFLTFIISTLIFTTTSLPETEILITFKSSIKDPKNTLSSWSNTSTAHLCNWTGITCSSTTLSPSVISLNLQGLNLSGEVSPSICQLPNLSYLNLADNLFNQPIPLHLSQCNSLETLNLSYNLIWGTIPDQISLFSSLKILDLSKNRIEGVISSSLGVLKNLQVLNLGSNLFSGSVPSSIFGNLSELIVLDLSENLYLDSEIPEDIGKLGKLHELILKRSNFHGVIPESLVELVSLRILDLSQNNLTGEIPLKLGLNLENLLTLDVSENMVSGSFPIGLCNGQSLVELNLHSNLFSGMIPNTFEECLNLERFQVQNNGFSEDFPNGIWLLPNIKVIRAENNRFTGDIPDSISNATQLEQVQLDNNSFTGRVPHGLGLLRSLYRFSASLNGLYGDLPQNFCDSPLMSILNLSNNLLSGNIPELKKCRKLVSLSLANNSFDGVIPHSLVELPVLTYLDLSDNNLTGSIPRELQNLKLALFNVSYNRLSGEVPFSLISGLPASFLEGNPDLCGPGLPKSCSSGDTPKHFYHHPNKLIFTLIIVILAAGIVLLAVGFFIKYIPSYSTQKPHSDEVNMVLFYPLRITAHDLMAGINEKNALGVGGTFGRVHAIKLPSGESIVVKKLMNSGCLSSKCLKTQIKTLAKIRHKNITKLLGFCYSDESIFLIYEFLQNGSLDDVISRLETPLDWSIRLKIALGAAHGLAYFHNDYVPRLLHRNVKSSNILLNVEYEPKLTDFSLDRIIGEQAYQSSIASELGNSCYIAPENGYSKKAVESMDVYSFGVVLLVLVTGKKAEQEDSGDSVDVVTWVRRKINTENGVIQVLDPKISDSSKQEMLAALDIAVSCTSVMPEKRPTMLEVVKSLQSSPCKTDSSGVQIELK